MLKIHILPSTGILILSGLLIWAGIFIVFSGGDFLVWTIAKFLYALGALFFVFNK